MIHGLSIDVEDYYQIIHKDYFNAAISPSAEVERNTHWILDALGQHSVHATFFVLATVAQSYPSIIQRIVKEGNEVGIHGYDHKYIYTLAPQQFRTEISRSKDIVESIAGVHVIGHRAPAFSITAPSLWALDILQELGFLYDSSIFPIQNRRYGIMDTPKSIYRLPNGLFEIPLSCIEIAGKHIPVAGGGYLRHFPYWWTKFSLQQLEKKGRSGNVYVHPYEFECSSPHIDYTGHPVSVKVKYKLALHNRLQSHNRGERQRIKFKRLLNYFTFVPLKTLYNPDCNR
jgi:polysaccharide deacetylase family protein (PEP-CTERM system associated)